MSISSNKASSIELVQPEIEATIQQAETSLSRFQENRDSGEDLQNCIDCLNQLRGIFVVVEVQGCVVLCQEAVALGNEVPVGANDDKNGLLSSLSNAIFILRRYTEYFSSRKDDHPALLLPVINELRRARRAKPYPESHFFEFDSQNQFNVAKLLGLDQAPRTEDFEHHAKRYRHMYQVGLLDMLRDRDPTISYRLIHRAAEGCSRLCAGEALSQFWALVALATDTMRRNEMQINDTRKRLFMKIEKYLREMALVGRVVGSKSAPDSLRKDLLYLLALSGDANEQVVATLQGFGLTPLKVTDKDLQDESRRLFGPGVDVLRSLSKAIQEEMIHLKEKLDILERGGEPNPEDLQFISSGLERLGGTLVMLDLKNIAEVCDHQASVVNKWADSERMISESELMTVADAILKIEIAIKSYEETGEQPEITLDTSGGHHDENAYLKEARLVVVEESEAGLALSKRAITSFIESKGDRLHLANLAQVMDTIRGGMAMIGQDRVSRIVATCQECINEELYESEQTPEEKILETLADALSSLEYYIESMKYKDALNDELLKLSEDSLKSIGYSV
ncbi:MAG: chemotaxis protein [Oleiphilaceae bacterium]|nr:chemotaxis protein [Oleiphilaceae bacterium]